MTNQEKWLEMSEDFGKKKDKEKSICKIKGSWLKGISFDDKEYWNVKNSPK